MSVNTRLKEIRENLKFSQERLAENLGISFRSYSNYETGKRSLPQELLQSLADLYFVNPCWLLTGIGSMFIPVQSDEQKETEHALSERTTIGQRLNWLQGDRHVNDKLLSQEINISESRLKDIGLDKKEPTLTEAVAICDYFGVTLDLFIKGRITGCVSDLSSNLTPEEKKMLVFLKKAKENNLL